MVRELREADCGSPVADVAGALPGGKAAGAASAYADAWKSTFATWCTDADQFAASLTTAAGTYVEGDHAAEGSLPDDHKMTGPR
jgi:hypothetical protein